MAIDVCEILTSEVRRAFGCGGGLQSLYEQIFSILFYSFLFLGTQCAEMKLESFFLLIMFIHRTSARDRRRMREACICSCFA